MKFSSPRPERFAGALVSAALLVLMAGCASPGVPRAPSLRLPERVTNLVAERAGNTVKLRFVTPQRTTDNELLRAPAQASLCRATGDGPCLPTASYPGKLVVAGPVEWMDKLPPELSAGAARRLVYRVELFNESGKSAGPSEPTFAAAGEAPHAVEGLRVEGSARGVVVRWTPEARATGEVLVEREAVGPGVSTSGQAVAVKPGGVAPKNGGKRKSRGAAGSQVSGQAGTRPQPAKEEAVEWLRAGAAASGTDSGGLVDGTAHADEPYRYTAVRSRTVTADGRKLELRSGVSAPVTFTLRDVFPPAVPQGLLAAGFAAEGTGKLEVDLVWQPDTEADLAGYNVYRQTLAVDGSAGTAVKLNEKLVELPAFHDMSAEHGVGYRYTVTAVDARGNESAASSPAALAAIP
jgi:hypothetical protein